MKIKKLVGMFILGLGACVGLVGGAAHGASYGTASIKYVSPAFGGVAGFSVDYTGNSNYDLTYNDNVYTGAYNFALDMSSPSTSDYAKANLTPSFTAYCIDVIQEASSSYQTYTIADLEDAPLNSVGPMTTAKANALRELFGRFYAGVDNVIKDEAFAAAIWEISYENGNAWDLDTGHFVMNGLDSNGLGNAHNLAELWLSQLNGDTSKFDYHLVALTNPGYQDYALTRAGTGGSPPIPEPLTASAVTMAAVALAGYLKRRTARKTAF
jgi:hypothetical protein